MMYTMSDDTLVVTVERPEGGYTVVFLSPQYMRVRLEGETVVVVDVDARWRGQRNYTDVWEVKGPRKFRV